MAYVTALEAFNRHCETRDDILARMPEGSHFAEAIVRRMDDGRIVFDAGWGTCTLDPNDWLEIQD